MSESSHHLPVCLYEVCKSLISNKHGLYIDGTYGRGGHSRLLLSQLATDACVWGMDRDHQAIAHGQSLQQEDNRFQIFHTEFAQIHATVKKLGKLKQVDGILLDIGVSSPQLDTPQRGFSFRLEGPLDMRMDNSQGLSAKEWLAQVDIKVLQQALKNYGDVKQSNHWAKLIKQSIVAGELNTTSDLAELVLRHCPPKRKYNAKTHPATAIFQAIRIAVNDELTQLERMLEDSLSILRLGGRLVVLTFHSLEHRLLRRMVRDDQQKTPLDLPVTQTLNNWQVIKLLAYPSEQEIEINPRARSARLTVLEKSRE